MQGGKPVGFQSAATSVNYSPEFNAPEPNLNLLARLADAGAGKFLDAAVPADPANNPFLHDRHRTFQPRDWWESLLKLAIALFVLDVGVRRIQIEREQWQKAWLRVRRAVIFWKGVPRPVQADESLAALLARRDQVRSTQATATPEASPALFQPRQPVVLPSRPADSTSPPPAPGTPPPEPLPSPAPGAQTTTTSRLLEAKRRAQKKKD
jgi:hypothetical protein